MKRSLIRQYKNVATTSCLILQQLEETMNEGKEEKEGKEILVEFVGR